MNIAQGLDRLRQLHDAASVTGQRRLAVLAGGRDWTRYVARDVLEHGWSESRLWIGDDAPPASPALTHRQAVHRLGGDLDLLVYDAWSGFDPDAFGAATGAVAGSGLILLLTPDLRDWPHRPDPAAARIAIAGNGIGTLGNRLITRLVRLLSATTDAWVWRQGQAPPPVTKPTPRPAAPPAGDPDCLTDDQSRAVAATEAAGRTANSAALVLTADRGRGKSAALGIAAGRLLGESGDPIVVTAPRSSAVDSVLRHARAVCPGAVPGKLRLRHHGALMEYTAPDALIHAPSPARLLLVDEAAGIPAPMLEALLQRFPRVVFATTIHGYEGTGRGFAIRFSAALDRLRPGWQGLTLQTPVRWAPGDPVERFTAAALLLDAEPAPANTVSGAAPTRVRYIRLDRDRLAGDEPTLRQVFGLMVNAHYRTTPTDLRNLLDGPTTAVHVLCHGSAITAAALTVDEGGFSEGLAAAVWLGMNRPHGHLLPQSLTFHAGHPGAAQLRCRRVMRIAVHPAARRRGLGLQLTNHIAARAQADGMDLIGASFGATAPLLAFWHAADFQPARLGHRREASSGVHAVMVVHGLNEAGRALTGAAVRRLGADLPTLLAGPVKDLEDDIREALPDATVAPRQPTTEDYLQAYGFALAHRPLASSLPALGRVVRAASGPDSPTGRVLVEQCIVGGHSLKRAAEEMGLESRKSAENQLRTAVREVLDNTGDPRRSAAWTCYEALRDMAGTLPDSPVYRRDDWGRLTAVSGACAATRRES